MASVRATCYGSTFEYIHIGYPFGCHYVITPLHIDRSNDSTIRSLWRSQIRILRYPSVYSHCLQRSRTDFLKWLCCCTRTELKFSFVFPVIFKWVFLLAILPNGVFLGPWRFTWISFPQRKVMFVIGMKWVFTFCFVILKMLTLHHKRIEFIFYILLIGYTIKIPMGVHFND